MMKVTTFAMMAGVVLALGMLPSESGAYCPCEGTPNPSNPDNDGICAVGSNAPKGPNGCTADPTGLLPPNPTDGKGCIEKPPLVPDVVEPGDDCLYCLGGSVFGGTGMPLQTDRGVQGCTCTKTMDTGDPDVDYTCLCVDTTTAIPTVIPCNATECEMFADDGCA